MELETTENKFKFETVKNFILGGLESNESIINQAAEKFNGNDEIVKTAVEHSFRLYVIQNSNTMLIEDMKKVIDLSIAAAQKKLCMPTTPIFLINDMMMSLTIDKCSEIFCYLEDSANIWKSELFYANVKNYLLRMCNDLLKRLSKSQNTVFSGRIHLFLAKLFPLNEKSGLNLMSHFSDNFTRYTTSAEVFEEEINKNRSDLMETDEQNSDKISTHSMPIDYNLYTKFWSLQEFFSKPNICYDKIAWKMFTTNSNEVLEALKSYRLEDVKETNKIDEFEDMSQYFSKYLTREKLLDLQLNDTNFRRQILMQFLVLFQYLNTEVKFKTPTQILTDEQNSWIKAATKKVYELLKETPPSGPKFTNSAKHILEREEIWNKWKNEGCLNYVKEKKPPAPTKPPAKRPKLTTSDFIINSEKPLVPDSSEISKLCNINHGNLEACKESSRQFLPSLKEFFEDAIDQLDPANQVEKQYQLVNDTDWCWKALRLLAKRSAYYFMQTQNVKSIPDYLEFICNRLGKEFSSEQQTTQQEQNPSQQDPIKSEPNDQNESKNNDEKEAINDKEVVDEKEIIDEKDPQSPEPNEIQPNDPGSVEKLDQENMNTIDEDNENSQAQNEANQEETTVQINSNAVNGSSEHTENNA